MQLDKFSPVLRKLLLPGLIVAAIAMPAIALNHGSINLQGLHFGQHLIKLRSAENGKISMLAHGKVRFNEDETNIAQVSNNVSIIEKRDAKIWRTDFYLDKQGKLQQRYWHNDVEQAFDSEGRRWLASVIPQLAREVSGNAGVRAARLYAKGGTAAVLKEIALIESAHAKSRYITFLIQQGPLEEAHLAQIFKSLATLDSDFGMSQILRKLVANQKLDAAGQFSVLDAMEHIDSDFEQAQLLKSLAPQLASDSKVVDAWQQAVATMDSDFEIRGVIQSIAHLSKPNAKQIGAALQASKRIDSDFERRSALESLAPHLHLAASELPAEYLQLSKGIDSNFERRLTLTTLLAHNKLSIADYERLFDVIDDMDSDFEIRQVLVVAARAMPNEPRLQQRYRSISQQLDSSERKVAERALSKNT